MVKAKNNKNLLYYLKRAWHFIWHEDSIASWIVTIILAFLIIKFIVYPGLGLIFGTKFPVVAVVSKSMEHSLEYDQLTGTYTICDVRFDSNNNYQNNFDSYWKTCGSWYEKRNITKNEFSQFPFSNGFNKGDIMVLIGKNPKEIKKGDVIVFQAGESYPIIHRVVDINSDGKIYFTTKGDNNGMSIRKYMDIKRHEIVIFPPDSEAGDSYYEILDETKVSQERLLGKAVLRIPFLGYIKIGFVELLNLLGINVPF